MKLRVEVAVVKGNRRYHYRIEEGLQAKLYRVKNGNLYNRQNLFWFIKVWRNCGKIVMVKGERR